MVISLRVALPPRALGSTRSTLKARLAGFSGKNPYM